MGRLLITSFLVWKKIMAEPMLYLSAYPKAHQQEYYDRLMQVCNSGDHVAWAAHYPQIFSHFKNNGLQVTL